MKKALLLLLFITLSTGCCSFKFPKEFKAEVQMNAERMRVWVERMDGGKTSPAQDRQMLKANLKAWKSIEGVVSK